MNKKNTHCKQILKTDVIGAGQEEFKGFYDNTEIYNKVAKLTKVVKD